jgi:hypothetical protein
MARNGEKIPLQSKTIEGTEEPLEESIPQDSQARKAWLDKAWAERERNGLE